MEHVRGIIKIEITRPNGETEVIDATDKFGGSLNQFRFDIARKQTENAGRGYIERAKITVKKTNFSDLVNQFNNLHNEGGEGYIPEESYFTNLPGYKEWEETVILN